MDKRTPTRTSRLRRLAETGWLALQPPDFQNRMAAIGRWIKVPKGKAIYRSGDKADAIFGLGDGLLDISLPVDEDEEVIVHRALSGYWIGDWALLSGLETVRNFVPWRILLRHWEAFFEDDGELAFDGVPFAD